MIKNVVSKVRKERHGKEGRRSNMSIYRQDCLTIVRYCSTK